MLLARDPDLGRQAEHAPHVTAPGAGARDEHLGLDRAGGRLDRVNEAVAEVDTGHLDALEDPDTLRAREAGEVLDRLHRLRPAPLPLVEHGLDPLAVPIGEDRAHVLGAGTLAEHDVRAVANLRLALLDRDTVLRL